MSRAAAISRVVVLTALAAGLGGCAGLDRERYSLVFRKPAHRYRELTPSQREELRLYEPTRVTGRSGFVDRVANQPFRPFRYCLLHGSHHLAESATSFVAAPVEMPVSIGTYMGTIAVQGGYRAVTGLGGWLARTATSVWERIFPPRQAPPVPEAPLPGRRSDR